MVTSNVGRWDRWYEGLDEPQPYGDTDTYRLGAEWLSGCELVEDWGCGKGWLRRFIEPEWYRGIDGSHSPFADEIVDLVTYQSSVPGVFMRHVLEHNVEWAVILDNALVSAQKRLCLVLFTPLVAETCTMAFADDPGVPDIAFKLKDLTDRIEAQGFEWDVETIPTATQYGVETIIRCER